jgi:hypothetical protein
VKAIPISSEHHSMIPMRGQKRTARFINKESEKFNAMDSFPDSRGGFRGGQRSPQKWKPSSSPPLQAMANFPSNPNRHTNI